METDENIENKAESRPQPPEHLRPATQAWWKSVVDAYNCLPHHLHLLSLACEALDRCEEAREHIAEHGMFTTGANGQLRKSPALQVEHDSQIRFARLLRELSPGGDVPSAPYTRIPRR